MTDQKRVKMTSKEGGTVTVNPKQTKQADKPKKEQKKC